MSNETSQYRQLQRWMGVLIAMSFLSACFCFYTFWGDTETGLLLALVGSLLVCIIGLRLYLFDMFILFDEKLSTSKPVYNNKNLTANLEQFFSASPDLFWYIRYTGREVDSLNQRYIGIHPGNSLLNVRISTLFPTRVARQYLEALIEVQSQNIVKHFEYQLSLPNGKTGTFEVRIQPFSVQGCIAMIRDITSLKEAEETLVDQQLFVHQVMDCSPCLVFVRDRFGRFLMLNQATQHIVNHDILVQSHLATEHETPFFTDENEVLEHKQSIRFIDSMLLPNGEKRWFEVTKNPLIRHQETYVLVIAIDITHLKLAEKSLAKSEKNYVHLIHQIAMPIAIVDRQKFVPVLTNHAMSQLLQKGALSIDSALPFIDHALQYTLSEHKNEDNIYCNITLPKEYGGDTYNFIFQPILYQEDPMFLVIINVFNRPVLDQIPTSLLTKNTTTFH